MVRPIIHSTKHYVQFSIFTVTAGTVNNLILSDSVAVSAKDTTAEVEEGSTIKAIYLELWARSPSATPSSGQCIIWKEISDESNPTATEMAALGNWTGKKKILHTFMGLINDNDSIATPIYKGWIKIPRGMQRQGLADRMQVALFSPTVDWNVCGFATYKEYT